MPCGIIGVYLALSLRVRTLKLTTVHLPLRDTWITEDDFRQIRDAGLSEYRSSI